MQGRNKKPSRHRYPSIFVSFFLYFAFCPPSVCLSLFLFNLLSVHLLCVFCILLDLLLCVFTPFFLFSFLSVLLMCVFLTFFSFCFLSFCGMSVLLFVLLYVPLLWVFLSFFFLSNSFSLFILLMSFFCVSFCLSFYFAFGLKQVLRPMFQICTVSVQGEYTVQYCSSLRLWLQCLYDSWERLSKQGNALVLRLGTRHVKKPIY